MLIPRYSLRLLLGLLTACSVLFFILAQGLRGSAIAAGIGIGVMVIVAILAVHVAGFAVFATTAKLTRPWRQRRSDVARSVLVAACCLPAVMGTVSSAQQFAPTIVNGANATSTTAHGLTLGVDSNWPGGHYRPILVEILSVAAKSPVDRQVTILATLESYSVQRRRLRVEQTVAVPGSGAPVRLWLNLPNIPQANQVRVEVLEHGRKLPSLMGWINWQYANDGWFGAVAAPTVLAIHDGTLDSSPLRQMLPHGDDMEWDYSVSPPRPITPAPRPLATLVQYSSPAPLPSRWLDYSGLDVVTLPLAKAQQLVEKQPQAWQAILRWSASGGQLWLHGGGERLENLKVAEELLGRPWGLTPAGDVSQDSLAPGWYAPAAKHYVPRVLDPTLDAAYGYMEQRRLERANQASIAVAQLQVQGQALPPSAVDAAQQADDSDESLALAPQPPPVAHFVWRPHGLGIVLVFRAENAFPGTPVEWGAVFNTLTPAQWNWERRHGLQLNAENPAFWQMLIRDVGFARVWTFQALITGFVIVVGPLNYWWCRRRRQLHLLLLTVPCLALLAAGGLVGYALAADGLGTRFRARSVTLLDERQGRAAAWSWQSYYAGLTPAGGLVFEPETFVAPIGPVAGVSLGGGDRTRRVIWDDRQRLRSGWLSARTPEQLLVVHSGDTRASLKLRSGADASLQVHNDLGSPITHLWAMDLAGRTLWGENIAAGADAALTPLAEPVGVALGRVAADHALSFPTEMQGLVGFNTQSLRMFSNAQASQFGISSATALGEQTLTAATTHNRWLAPGRYVAVVERGPELETGLPQVAESDSYHVVLGQW